MAAVVLVISSCHKNSDPPNNTNANLYNSNTAASWMEMETRLIKTTTNFTPPVASRAIAYTGITLYESVVPGTDHWRTVHDALSFGYTLPSIDISAAYNWDVAANAALKSIMLNLFANTSAANKAAIDSLYNAIDKKYLNEVPGVRDRSLQYGQSVANVVYNWSLSDGGDKAYDKLYPASYVPPAGPGLWVPTLPAFPPIPMLPYWGDNRPFSASDVAPLCLPSTPVAYSTDSASAYWAQAIEVYNISKSLTADQKAIALFWADGGNTFTPPGHMLNIATQLIRQQNTDLSRSAEIYLRMGLAVGDAFISCWKVKYTYNAVRPVTFIRQYIDTAWKPLIITPPFPEYASGHSTVSGAAAEVLTAMFGNIGFTDHTNEPLGMTARSFGNFYEAADEAAMSRLYGGIHYRNSNNNAMTCGRAIGKNVAAISLH
jgi:PAP2 superfamily